MHAQPGTAVDEALPYPTVTRATDANPQFINDAISLETCLDHYTASTGPQLMYYFKGRGSWRHSEQTAD